MALDLLEPDVAEQDAQIFGQIVPRDTAELTENSEDEIETWLTAPWAKAKALQRPLPNHILTVVPKPERARA